MSNSSIPIHDIMLKTLLIGDSSVGKTCVLLKYVNDIFSPSSISTLGIDFKIHNIVKNGKKVKLQIWDTAGQERFRTITQSYYRATHGVIIMYDITDRTTFSNVKYWMTEIMKSDEKIVKILVGNKSDLNSQRAVEFTEGAKIAKEYEIPFFETSAKTGQNITQVFDTLIELSMNYVKMRDNVINVGDSSHYKPHKRCCT